jgi:uncharacterized membrane protein (UPF0127 family)
MIWPQGVLLAALTLAACTADGRRAHPKVEDPTARTYVSPKLPHGHVVVHDPFGGAHRVEVEIAADPGSRERGLMWRKSLKEGTGMLFVFPEPAEHQFWMKNTLIPLDMLFIGRDKRVVGVVAQAQPGDLTPVGPQVPSLYVLEVPSGWAAKRGIAEGGQVEIEGISMLDVTR